MDLMSARDLGHPVPGPHPGSRVGAGPAAGQDAGRGDVGGAVHVDAMGQAIEEEVLLDVLENYTLYKLAFRLAHEGADYDEHTVERSAALKCIMGWVRLHPYNIAQKVAIVVEAVCIPTCKCARPPRRRDIGATILVEITGGSIRAPVE